MAGTRAKASGDRPPRAGRPRRPTSTARLEPVLPRSLDPVRPRAAGTVPRGDDLWDLLAECHRGVRAELRAVVLRHGIYLTEYRALRRLATGPKSLSQLAEGLGLTPASLTDLAGQLTRRRWAERRPHPTDRRSHLLVLTAAGARVQARARREYRSRLSDVYSALPDRSRDSLYRGLRNLSEVLSVRLSVREGRAAETGEPAPLPGGATGRPWARRPRETHAPRTSPSRAP